MCRVSLHPALALGKRLHLMLVAAVVCVGCGRHGTQAPKGGSTNVPGKIILARSVELAQVEQKPLVYKVETVGILEAEGQTDIAAGVTGVVDEVLFREGDYVSPGTLLALVDQTRYKSDDELARANLERAKANVDLAKDQVNRTLRVGFAIAEEEKVKARGNLQVAEAEYRASVAALTRASHNLHRSQVRAPYAGRINKRLITKGSYLEERTSIATMADLSHIRLVGYVPETAATLVRELLETQEQRLDAVAAGMIVAGLGPVAAPWSLQMGAYLAAKDFVLSGYDPEFELHALPGLTHYGRIFYMSTVGSLDTHMFETKAEVLGWSPEPLAVLAPAVNELLDPLKPAPQVPAAKKANGTRKKAPLTAGPQFWPGYTAKIRFPLKSNSGACVVHEESIRASERGFIAFVPAKLTRDDGSVEWVARLRVLELGFRAAGWVEVRQGLAPHEWVVRRGAEALEDGAPIRFKDGPQ